MLLMVDGGSDHDDNEGTLVLIEDLRAQRNRHGSSEPQASRLAADTLAAREPTPEEDLTHLALGIADGCQPNADQTVAQHDSTNETSRAADSGTSPEEVRPPGTSPDETLNRLDGHEPRQPTRPADAGQTSSPVRAERNATHAGATHGVPAGSSVVLGTAHLPKDTPTSRPKRQRARPLQRHRDKVATELPQDTTRRSSRRRRAAVATTAVLALTASVLVAIAAMLANSPVRDAPASTAATKFAARVSNPAPSASLISIALLAEHAVAGIDRQVARNARTARHPSRSRARTLKNHHSTTSPSRHSTATAPPAAAAATSTQAPSQSTPAVHYTPSSTSVSAHRTQAGPTQAGPSGPGTIVGNNCDPQCS